MGCGCSCWKSTSPVSSSSDIKNRATRRKSSPLLLNDLFQQQEGVEGGGDHQVGETASGTESRGSSLEGNVTLPPPPSGGDVSGVGRGEMDSTNPTNHEKHHLLNDVNNTPSAAEDEDVGGSYIFKPAGFTFQNVCKSGGGAGDDDDDEDRRSACSFDSSQSSMILDGNGIGSRSCSLVEEEIRAYVQQALEDPEDDASNHRESVLANFAQDRGFSTGSGGVTQSSELIRTYDAAGHKVLNEYSVVFNVGKGSFAKVKYGMDTKRDIPVAIKILNRQSLARSGAINKVIREIQVMKTFRHPNLVKMLGVIDDAEARKLYIVLEWMSNGVIFKTPSCAPPVEGGGYKPSVFLTTQDIAQIRTQFSGVVLGLQHLHKSNILHLDIKPENILVDADGVCKLADFGVSKILENSEFCSDDIIEETYGTPAFFAPEMIHSRHFHGKAVDVWALGVTMYVAVYRVLPFTGANLRALNESIQKDPVVCPGSRGVPIELRDLLYRMLCKDPNFRPTADQIVAHPFFKPRMPIPLDVAVWRWKEAKILESSSQEDLMVTRRKFWPKSCVTNKDVEEECMRDTPLFAHLAKQRSHSLVDDSQNMPPSASTSGDDSSMLENGNDDLGGASLISLLHARM